MARARLPGSFSHQGAHRNRPAPVRTTSRDRRPKKRLHPSGGAARGMTGPGHRIRRTRDLSRVHALPSPLGVRAGEAGKRSPSLPQGTARTWKAPAQARPATPEARPGRAPPGAPRRAGAVPGMGRGRPGAQPAPLRAPELEDCPGGGVPGKGLRPPGRRRLRAGGVGLALRQATGLPPPLRRRDAEEGVPAPRPGAVNGIQRFV